MYWATMRVKGREIVTDSSWEELGAKGNTPDFMHEQFIVFSFDGT